MKAGEILLARLNQILEQGVLARSACSGQFLKQITPLLQSGVIGEERAGAGRRLVVRDSTALRLFVQKHFPDLPVDAAALARETAVARFRDTKALKGDTPEIVSVRTWSETALRRVPACDSNDTDHCAGSGAFRATRDYGAFSFLLGRDCPLQLRGLWALVENPAVFVHFERLDLPIPAALYSRGRVSNRLLDWLASQASGDFGLIHFPDYDPAGLIDYQRLRIRLGERVSLHLPEDIGVRFEKLSNASLLRKGLTRSMLAGLRSCGCAEILRVVELIDRYNAGLEQEALLVNL